MKLCPRRTCWPGHSHASWITREIAAMLASVIIFQKNIYRPDIAWAADTEYHGINGSCLVNDARQQVSFQG